MVEAFEKDVPINDRKEVESGLAKRLSNRVSRHIISRSEDKRKYSKMGLSFLGAIGWHIPVPTVLGTLFGRWLDGKYPDSGVPWTLNMLLLGLGVGIISTWLWLEKEGIKRAQDDQKLRDEKIKEMHEEIMQNTSDEDVSREDFLDDV